MATNASDEGFQAHSKNAKRKDNPHVQAALNWDKGWAKRERQRLIHNLEKELAENLGEAQFIIVRDSMMIDP